MIIFCAGEGMGKSAHSHEGKVTELHPLDLDMHLHSGEFSFLSMPSKKNSHKRVRICVQNVHSSLIYHRETLEAT